MASPDAHLIPIRGGRSSVPANSLPTELIQMVVDRAPLKSSINVTYALGHSLSVSAKHAIIARRYDIRRYLKQLTDDPEELLATMLQCKIILSGSRGAGYFEPALVSYDSDWDFFSGECIGSIIVFMWHLRSIGVEWQISTVGANAECGLDGYENEIKVITGRLMRHGKTHSVTVICKLGCLRAFNAILDFHSSIVQCFISGFAAVSLYSASITHGYSLRWGQVECGRLEFSKLSQTAVNKYLGRGVKYITYERYSETHSKGGSLQVTSPTPAAPSLIRPRSLADSDSYVVPFVNTLRSVRDRMYAGQCMRALSRLAWRESPYVLATPHEGSEDVPAERALEGFLSPLSLAPESVGAEFNEFWATTLETTLGRPRTPSRYSTLYPC